MRIRTFLALLWLFPWLPQSLFAAEDNLVRRLTSRYEGKIYEFIVMQSDLDAAPAWAETDENPPLSARSALSAAREFVTREVPDSSRWTVSKISLERSGQKRDHWIYVVEFTSFPERDQVLLGPGHSFAIPVLMNRTVPRSKVTLAKVPKTNE